MLMQTSKNHHSPEQFPKNVKRFSGKDCAETKELEWIAETGEVKNALEFCVSPAVMELRHVSRRAGGREILSGVSFTIQEGEFVGIIGPNGSGKTSLLTLLSGVERLREGEIFLRDVRLNTLPRRELARKIALVEQHAETLERITARQAVELGRIPHLGTFSSWGQEDEARVEEALRCVDMLAHADQLWQTLSGGERQRINFARALAQEPDILVLDEPTNHLDIQHQLALLRLARAQGLTTIAALHDLNHAALFCDRIAVLEAGHLVIIGSPEEVLTPALVRGVFHVDAHIEKDPIGRLHIRYF